MKTLIDFILHIDVHLAALIAQYGALTYGILFLIVFVETGVVIMPFLPGDSLIFAAATLAAIPANGLNIYLIGIAFVLAAFLGDNVNYFLGRWVGPRAFSGKIRFLKKEYLDKTQAFFAKHGSLAIIYARFVPIVRTFSPFVAGAGMMPYAKFISRSLLASLLWVTLFATAGYLFGNVPFIQHNFSKVILAIIVLSLVPMIVQWITSKRKSKTATHIDA